jgi:hypothetical protein
MIKMTIVRPAHGGADGCELAKPQSRLSSLLRLSPRLPANSAVLSVVVLALALGGCARDPARGDLSAVHSDFKRVHREVRATPVRLLPRRRVYAETQPPAELRVHRPDPALLAAQPAPHCEFANTDLKAVDPDEWERLKTEFERKCYQDAEKAARDRLGQLQASSTCEIERVPQSARHEAAGAK